MTGDALMGQGRRRCGVVIAGLVGLALLTRAGGMRAGNFAVPPAGCPFSGSPVTDRSLLLVPSAPDAGLPAPGDPATELPFLYPDRREAGGLFGDDADEGPPAGSAPAQLPGPAGLPPALADIHAAEAGTLSLDDDAAPQDDLPSLDPAPAAALPPRFPEAPALPDPRALLA